MRPSPATLALSAAFTAGLAGTGVAYTAMSKDVTLTVDGAKQQVHTFGTTVAHALDAARVDTGPGDVVTPALDTPVRDGTEVAVPHTRRLAVEGQRRTVWVTAASVEEALDRLGVRADNAVLSASRSRRIPRRGMTLDVQLPDRVTVLVDGRRVPLASAAPTVRDALAHLRVRLAPTDRVSVPLDRPLADGQTIRVTRIAHQRVEQRVPAAPPVQQRPDPGLYRGDTKVVQPGRPGQVLQVADVTLVDGKPVKRAVLSTRALTPAVPRVVRVGVKTRPASVAGADGLNWGALARCESGGNPRAVSASGAYRGLYQFSMSTWHAVGGSGDPIDASPGEQTYRAKVLYARAGRGQWPICGRHL